MQIFKSLTYWVQNDFSMKYLKHNNVNNWWKNNSFESGIKSHWSEILTKYSTMSVKEVFSMFNTSLCLQQQNKKIPKTMSFNLKFTIKQNGFILLVFWINFQRWEIVQHRFLNSLLNNLCSLLRYRAFIFNMWCWDRKKMGLHGSNARHSCPKGKHSSQECYECRLSSWSQHWRSCSWGWDYNERTKKNKTRKDLPQNPCWIYSKRPTNSEEMMQREDT